MKLLSAILGIHLLVLAQGATAPQEETSDDKLRQELQQRYRGVLRQADLDRRNDPNLYMQRLTAVEVQLLNRTKLHAGLRNGIGSMMAKGDIGLRPSVPQSILFQPEAVPFLLDILINGPPSQGKGLAKAAHPEREYWHSWKPGEYELWARCLAAWIVGSYKHPDVVPILDEHRKRASQPELRRSSGAGLVASRDPNAIAPLMEALSDSDSDIRRDVWFSVNYMTGRGMNYFADPSPEQIAEFKRWWQENREAVIAKIYNPETGRLEPKYTLPPEEIRERHLPSKPVPEGTLLLAMSVRGDSPGLSSDYDGEWLVQYCDPNGVITELMQQCAVVLPDFLLAVHPLRKLGGELLVSFEADGEFVPWAYVRHASTHPVKLTQEADFVIEQDKQVPVTLTCRRTSELENYQSIGLYYAEDSRLPLYQVDLGSGLEGADSSWSATLEIMPGTYHIQGKPKGEGQNQSLGQIRVQAQDEAQVFDLSSIDGDRLVEETGDDELRQELQQRYRGVLRQADLDRQNDPNLYMQRLTAVELDLQGRTELRGGLRGGIGSMDASVYYGHLRLPEPQGVLYHPEAVPFLLDILVNGPPSQGKGLAQAARPEKEYWYPWKPGEYELWARCLAAWIVGRYKHPDVLPILGEHRKRASQPELRRSSCAGIVAARDPNAIAPLIEALSDSDPRIREDAWLSVNFLTERALDFGTDPSPEQIAEFKRWWQENREAVIAKVYNPETGRFEPKFPVPPEEKRERHLPRRPVPEGTLLLGRH